MFETLQLVDAAVARVQSSAAADRADPDATGSTSRAFPIIGYSLTSDTVPQTRPVGAGDLRHQAAAEPRCPASRASLVQGGQRPEFHVSRRSGAACCAPRSPSPTSLDAINRTQHRSTRRACSSATISCFSAWSAARRTRRKTSATSSSRHVERRAGARAATSAPSRRRSSRSTRSVTRERQAGGAAQRQPAAGQQHRAGRRRSPQRDRQRSARRCRRASTMRPFYDQSDIVSDSIASVRDAIIIGLFLAGADHLAVPARLGHGADGRPGRFR